MKSSKVFLLITAVLITVVCLVACNGDGGTVVTTAQTTAEAPLSVFESLKIGSNDLSSYTIVYAESELADEAAANPTYYPVWDFNKETAERLSDLIYEVAGIRLSIACDVNTEETENEILIGETDRSVSKSLSLNLIATEKYKICVSGSKLVICGGREGSTWHAIDYLETLFESELTARNATYVFASDMTYEGKYEFIRIGCIGDSITQGIGVDSVKHAYPAQLERWLWKDAIVYNFGNSGKTMRDAIPNWFHESYMSTGTYENALMRASNIDIFTVMLGTNDSNRVWQNGTAWKDEDTANFKSSCEKLFLSLKEKNSAVEFVIMNCPAYFGNQSFGSAKVRSIQSELVDEMNAKGYKTSFFDMYTVTKPFGDNISKYCPDALHPNAEGHTIMAQALAAKIDELIHADN